MRFALTALALFLLAPVSAFAQGYQPPDITAQRAAMERLAPIIGSWEGEANVTMAQAMVVHQTERVETALAGLLLLIRGAGYATSDHSGEPVFQAYAVISFNERSGVYEVRSYTHEGHVTTATGEFLEDGRFRWGFAPGGPVRMRFTMTLDADSWSELGEMSYDNGATWRPTVEMSLVRAP